MAVVALPPPPHCRSVDDALAVAKHMDLPNIVILSELDDGAMLVLHAVDLTAAQLLWTLECGKRLLMSDFKLVRGAPKDIA